MLCFEFQVPIIHCRYMGEQLTFVYNLVSSNLARTAFSSGWAISIVAILWDFQQRQIIHWPKLYFLQFKSYNNVIGCVDLTVISTWNPKWQSKLSYMFIRWNNCLIFPFLRLNLSLHTHTEEAQLLGKSVSHLLGDTGNSRCYITVCCTTSNIEHFVKKCTLNSNCPVFHFMNGGHFLH